MQYKTHLSPSLVVVLPVLCATDNLTLGTVLTVSKYFASSWPS